MPACSEQSGAAINCQQQKKYVRDGSFRGDGEEVRGVGAKQAIIEYGLEQKQRALSKFRYLLFLVLSRLS